MTQNIKQFSQNAKIICIPLFIGIFLGNLILILNSCNIWDIKGYWILQTLTIIIECACVIIGSLLSILIIAIIGKPLSKYIIRKRKVSK